MSVKNLSKILVVDIECAGEPYDFITEIGISVLDIKTKEIEVPNDDIFLFPPPKINPDIKYFNYWRNVEYSNILNRYTYLQAVDFLKKEYKSHKYVWASYGEFDKNKFMSTVKEYYNSGDLHYPFDDIKYPNKHINVKTLAALHLGLDREVGMMKTLEMMGIEHKGIHHSGKDDTYNIARI